jgi:periplasmic divalent cation tolerance protein
MNGIVVLSTTGSDEVAQRIARALVETGDAACVNIIPGIRSIYRWQGKICEDGEWLLVIKTVASRFEAVRTRIRELHTYQLPEIVCFDIDRVDPDYLAWLAG